MMGSITWVFRVGNFSEQVWGISPERHQKAFNVKTIGDLGRNKFVVAAVAIASLAGKK